MLLIDIYSVFDEGLDLSFSNFNNREKRTDILYLLSALILSYYVYAKSKIKYSFFKYIFNKKVWTRKSARIDYYMFFFNSFIKILLIAPYLFVGVYISFYTNEYLLERFGYPTFNLSVTETLVFYTIALTLIGDLTVYLVHYLMHKFEFLWEFHKIHHSATVLNPITQYRLHPVELILNNIRGILVFGLLTGIFDYLSNHEISIFMFLGANVFSFIFLFLGANLRHSHVKLKYFSFLEHIFISPFQHQIHHSRNPIHFNKNMGSKFALWDWMFGTLIVSDKTSPNLIFGLGNEDMHYNSFWKTLYNPFKKVVDSFKK